MKRKTFTLLLLILMLTSILSTAFITKPSTAGSFESPEPFLEEEFKGDEGEFFERELDTKQDEALENLNQTPQNSQKSEEEWNFNDTSEWSNFAYKDGDKTRLIVGVNGEYDSLPKLEEIATEHQAQIVNTVSIKDEIQAAIVEVPWASIVAFVEDVRSANLATYIEPNMKVETQFVPNDPYWNMQWGPQKIEADWAWNTTMGDSSILVAIVDTGIDYTHSDLASNYVALGYDWVNIDDDPMDDQGHGTHCAGIVAAVINNSMGISGLAQVRVMTEKVLSSSGSGYWDWVANGIIHATDVGADIISMSLSGGFDSELLHDAVKYAYDSGVLVVAAASNYNSNAPRYPAYYDEVIAVAATDQYDNKASFSNWGEWIELAAPGVDIFSTVLGGYASKSGTSMACPHVAGVAALIWSQHSNKTRDWVRLWLRYTADDLGDVGFDIYYGYGRINARMAVEQSPPAHDLIAYEWSTPSYVEPGASEIINATVLNFGDNNETDVLVQLLANGTVVNATIIELLTAGNSTLLNLYWNPTLEGLYNVTLYVVPVPGETSLENNLISEYIFVGFPIKAFVLSSAGNFIGEIITNWQVLNSEWHRYGDSMIYIDYETLNKEDITYEDIVATTADVLIISCAFDPSSGWEFTDSEIEAIGRYVHEGHGLIATAGTLYYRVPNNNKLAPLFGLEESIMWGVVGTDLMHLVNASHPLFTDVPDPYVFPYTGTSLPWDGSWDSNELTGGEYLALGHYQESSIVEYRGLVYISPWLEIAPVHYDHHLQLLYNAITWSRYQKPEHELVVSLETPPYIQPGESTQLNASVFNLGTNNETDVDIYLLIDDITVNSTTIPKLLSGESYELTYSWTPLDEGVYNVTVNAPPVPNEESTYDNVESNIVYVHFFRYVLFDQTHGTDNILSYSVWVTDLTDRGYVVDTLTTTPITLPMLEMYDVFVVPQAHSYYSSGELAAIQGFVSTGGGLLVIGDDSPSIYTDLTSFVGISWISGGTGGVTTDITPHEVTLGVSSVYLSSPIAVMNVLGVAQDLVRDLSGNIVLAVSENVGRVAGFADENSLMDSYITQESNLLLAYNMIDWLVRPRLEHDLAAYLDAPVFLGPGDSSLLNATVYNRGLNNETGVEMFLLINGSVVGSVVVPELLVGSSYTLSHLWTPTVEAMYNVTAYAPPVTGENNTANNIHSMNVAVTDVPNILAYVEYADYDEEFMNALTAIDSTFGPNYLLTELWDYTQLGSMLSGNDILFVPEQERASLSTMEMIGANWSTTLSNFMAEGGTIIICDFSGGSYGILSGAGLMSISGGYGITGSTVYLVDPLDPLAENVSSTFIAPNGARNFITTEANVVFYDGTYPVVIHKTIGIGHIALIGFDYFASNDDADKILGNAVGLWMAVPYDHELVAWLDAPVFLGPGDSSLLNATVYNRGLNNETGVEMFLLINGSVVGSVVVPELLVGSSYTLSYLWTPTIEAAYNATAYVVPVPGENVTANNICSRDIVVSSSFPGTYIAISPSTTTLVIGESFTISVYLSNVANLYGFDIWLSWDPTLLDYVNHIVHIPVEDYPDGILHEPIWWLINEVNETIGTYNLVCASMHPAPSYTGSGIIFEMTFQAHASGSFTLDIFSSDLVARSIPPQPPQPIPHAIFNCIGEIVEPSPILRDVAINNVTVSQTTVHVRQPINITVVAVNVGNFFETFNTTVYYGNTSIGTQTIVRLAPGGEITLIFVWNTTGLQPLSNCTLWAEASVVPGETNLDNNVFVDGTVKISALGDINGNGKVDVFDIILAVAAYDSQPGDPNWNPAADLAPIWGRIDIYDLVTIVSLFGTY